MLTVRLKEVIAIINILGFFASGHEFREIEEEKVGKRGLISRWFTVSTCHSEQAQKILTTLLICFSLMLLFLFF